MRKYLWGYLSLVLLTGCTTKDPRVLDPGAEVKAYQDILGNLEKADTVTAGSPEAESALNRIKDFYSIVTPQSVREKCAGVYADTVWFNDTVKTIQGLKAVEEYLVLTAKAVDQFDVIFTDIVESKGNYYMRWIMTVRLKGEKEEIKTIGMTHVRFNAEGKVILHQDYWDSSAGLYEHIPLVGGLIRYVQQRI